METSITVRAARAIMGKQLATCSEEVPVPFTRADLYRMSATQAFLFHIPAGSFRDFPGVLLPVHREEDVEHEHSCSWVTHRAPEIFVALYPNQGARFQGLPLWEQEVLLSSESVLTPYEIACIAAYWQKMGKGRLFSGQVRTKEEVGFSSCHLHAHPLTVILSYDEKGSLRLGRGYASQVGPELGILSGRRSTLRA